MLAPLHRKGAKGAPNRIRCRVASVRGEFISSRIVIREMERARRDEIRTRPGVRPAEPARATANDRAVVFEVLGSDQLSLGNSGAGMGQKTNQKGRVYQPFQPGGIHSQILELQTSIYKSQIQPQACTRASG